MGGSDYTQHSSRLADDARSWQAICQGDVTDWTKTDDVILAMVITTAAHTPGSETFQLQFSPNAGVDWYDVGTSGAVRYKNLTELTDGGAIAGGDQSGCAGTPLDYTEEIDLDALSGSVAIDKNDYAEFHFGLDFSNADDGTTYSFRLWSSADGGSALGTAAAELTTESGVTQYTITTTIDGVLVDRFTLTTTIDAQTRARETLTTTIDGLLRDRLLATTTVDAIAVDRKILATTLDSRLVDRKILTTLIDAFVQEKNKTVDTTIDAFTQEKNKLLTTTIDAFLQYRGEVDTTIDAILKALNKTLETTIDSRLVDRIAEETIIDSILVDRLLKATTIDGLTRARKTVSTTIDAWVGSVWKDIIQIALTLKDRNIDLTLKERRIYLTPKERGISISLVGEDLPHIGDTFWIEGVLTEKDGTPLDPDTHKITLFDPTGTQASQDTSPSGSGGTYEAELSTALTDLAGPYTIEYVATKNSKDWMEEHPIFIEERKTPA